MAYKTYAGSSLFEHGWDQFILKTTTERFKGDLPLISVNLLLLDQVWAVGLSSMLNPNEIANGPFINMD